MSETATTQKARRQLKRCACSDFEVGITTDGPDGPGSEPQVTIETTGCNRQTKLTFAQGHDAKLVSFLVKAELERKEIRWGRAGGTLISTDEAVGALRHISDALAIKAEKALVAALDKKVARETREQAKAKRRQEREAKSTKAMPREVPVRVIEPDPQVTQPLPPVESVGRSAKIKVGRWEYDAVIDNETGAASYSSKSGGFKTVKQGQYTEIN